MVVCKCQKEKELTNSHFQDYFFLITEFYTRLIRIEGVLQIDMCYKDSACTHETNRKML